MEARYDACYIITISIYARNGSVHTLAIFPNCFNVIRYFPSQHSIAMSSRFSRKEEDVCGLDARRLDRGMETS